MKKFTLFITILFSFLLCRADYDPISLPRLIKYSRLIAECKIIAVLETEIEIQIVDIVKGAPVENKLRVSKFTNWTCAHRWSGYKAGQSELMFLDKTAQNTWYILGVGNEGEMPVQADTVYYKEIYLRMDSVARTFELNDGYITGYKYNLAGAKKAIRQYLQDEVLIMNHIRRKTIRKYTTNNRFLIRIIDELKEGNYN